jgi:hypothetical protein
LWEQAELTVVSACLLLKGTKITVKRGLGQLRVLFFLLLPNAYHQRYFFLHAVCRGDHAFNQIRTLGYRTAFGVT